MFSIIIPWLNYIKVLIEFITEKSEKKQHILGMGSSNTENSNNSNFYSYLKKNDLAYMNYINQTSKSASNIRGIAQLLRSMKKLETIINIKSNFRRY